MVKGVSRQVIVLRPREEMLFEQAIFLLKEGAGGVSDEELLTQARKAASRYLKNQQVRRGRLRYLFAAGYLTLGAVLASGGWAAFWLLMG